MINCNVKVTVIVSKHKRKEIVDTRANVLSLVIQKKLIVPVFIFSKQLITKWRRMNARDVADLLVVVVTVRENDCMKKTCVFHWR